MSTPPILDAVLDLAFTTAKKQAKLRPPIGPPARMAPILRFTKTNERARDTTHRALLEDDEFRSRVLEKATEGTVGRAGMALLERSNDWEALIDRLAAADAEPIAPVLTERDAAALRATNVEREKRIAELEETVEQTRTELGAAQRFASNAETDLAAAIAAREAAERDAVSRAEERQRAVAELKHIESVMARHIGERKRLEQQVADLVAAQLSTSIEGGAVTDELVRAHLDQIDEAVKGVATRLAALRSEATPTTRRVERRTALPIPPGLFDTSPETTEYLLRIPGMLVFIDGYNVTKSLHDDWPLDQQRDWLVTALRSVSAQTGAEFAVVFDGADVSDNRTSVPGVQVQFSPAGVEADDVVIEAVHRRAPNKPVVVVSNDRRVRDGAEQGGANLFTVEQLNTFFA